MCCLTPAQWDTSSTDEQFVCVCSSKQGWCLWLPKQWPHGLATIILHLAIPLLGVSRGQSVVVCYNDISIEAPPTTYDGYPLITLLCCPSCSPHHHRRHSVVSLSLSMGWRHHGDKVHISVYGNVQKCIIYIMIAFTMISVLSTLQPVVNIPAPDGNHTQWRSLHRQSMSNLFFM